MCEEKNSVILKEFGLKKCQLKVISFNVKQPKN